MKTSQTLAYSTTIFTFCLMLLPANLAAQEVYRDIGEDGVPSFSDEQQPNSEIVDVKETSTFSNQDLLKTPARKKQTDSLVQSKLHYTQLNIATISNESAVRNNAGTLDLSITIVPDLGIDHTAELVMNGLNIRSLSASGVITLANVDRGTHQFFIRIVDLQGTTVDEGPTVPITMLRYAKQRP